MKDQVRALWAKVSLQSHAEPMQLVSLPADQFETAAALVAAETVPVAALIREPGGVSITISERTWIANRARTSAVGSTGPYRAITLDVEVDPSVCGFLAPATARLASAGIAIVPQCGYLRDHLLVPAADLERALEALHALIADCRK
jgi:hypothetical protein